METLIANLVGRIRRATLNGREYIIAPLTTIVPGVLSGSKGALYYPPDEIARNNDSWNGMPIVVYHPIYNGQHVSARHPGILERQGVGTIFKTATRNGKLQHEGWFDVEATKRVDNRVLQSLEAGTPIELSTGLYTDNEPAAGTHNGKSYEFIARNYRPDHLAILPDQVGACSLRDGCGVLVNKQKPLAFEVDSIENCGGEGGSMGPCPHESSGNEGSDYTAEEERADEEQPAMGDTKDTTGWTVSKYGDRWKVKTDKGEVKKFARTKREAESFISDVQTHGLWTVQGITHSSGVSKKTIWQRLGEYLGITSNAKGQPRHPSKGHWQGKADVAAKKGFENTGEPDEEAEPIDDEDEIEQDRNEKLTVSSEYTDDGTANSNSNGDITANPFVSEDQRRYLWANEPDIAEAWAHGEHTSDKDHKMPSETGKDVKGPLAKQERKEQKAAKKKLTENNDMSTWLLVDNEGGFESDEQRQAFFGMLSSGDKDTPGAKSKEADDKSASANKGSRASGHLKAAELHRSAAKAHFEAAKNATDKGIKTGHGKAASEHNAKASAHEMKAKSATRNTEYDYSETGDTDMALDRKATINFLVTNCDCWKGDERTLNAFTDEKLAKLLANAHVVEAVKKKLGSEITVNAMPAALAKFHAGKKKDEGDEGDSEPDEDDMEKNAGGNQSQAHGGGKGTQAGGAGTKGEYQNNKRVPLVERLTPDERQVWNTAVRITANAKKSLVARLVANAPEEHKQRLVSNLMKKELGELEDLVSLIPVSNQRLGYGSGISQELEPELSLNYLGAGGTSPNVVNQSEEDKNDILELPTINYADWKKEEKEARQA